MTAVLVFAACDDGAGPPDEEPVLAVQRVVITPDSVEIDVFGEVRLEAVVYGPNNVVLTGRAIEWASGDTMLAVVSGSGQVTGRGVGRVSVTATVEGVSGSADVVLTAPPIARVVASPESVVVAEGRSKALSLVAVDVQGREIARYPFEIGQASDPAVASVDAAGMVTGLAPGITAVSVRADTAATSVLIRVDPEWVEVIPSHNFACALSAEGARTAGGSTTTTVTWGPVTLGRSRTSSYPSLASSGSCNSRWASITPAASPRTAWRTAGAGMATPR